MKSLIFLFLFSSLGLAQAPQNGGAAPVAVDPSATAPVPDENQATAPISDLKKEFIYNENEGRDPFKVYRDPTIMMSEKTTETKPTEEKSDKVLVRNIKTISVPTDVVLLGIVYNKDNPVAAIKVTDGKTYYMRKNDTIGRHEGKIVDITRNTVHIEQYREFDGQKNLEKIVLKFRKNEQN